MKYEYSFCFDFFFKQKLKIAKITVEDVQKNTSDSALMRKMVLEIAGKEIFTSVADQGKI